jgi:hypothetical protein
MLKDPTQKSIQRVSVLMEPTPNSNRRSEASPRELDFEPIDDSELSEIKKPKKQKKIG